MGNKKDMTELPVVSIRLVREAGMKYEGHVIRNAFDAVDFIRNEFKSFDREHLGILNLNAKGEVINFNFVSTGNISSTCADPRDIFKSAILSNAAGILMVHNHPSGDVTPSNEDYMITKRIKDAGKLIGIPLVDHIIVGAYSGEYISLRENGKLESIEAAVIERAFNVEETKAPYGTDKKSFRKEVAEMFIKSLETEPLNWKKQWSFKSEKPFNAIKNSKYKGINLLYLSFVAHAKGYTDPRWLTFKQAQDKGYRIKAHEKGTKVEYWMPVDQEKKKAVSWDEYNRVTNNGKDRPYFQTVDGKKHEKYAIRSRYFTVFNAEQVEGIEKYKVDLELNDIEPSKVVEAVSKGMGVRVVEKLNSERAYYSPDLDEVHLPDKKQFESVYAYQATAMHELSHSTGHKDRLNRDQTGTFGSKNYAFEELVAEISSVFMAEYFITELPEKEIKNHAAYIQSWADAIKSDENYLFRAISKAEEAADYMIDHGELEHLRTKNRDVIVSTEEEYEI